MRTARSDESVVLLVRQCARIAVRVVGGRKMLRRLQIGGRGVTAETGVAVHSRASGRE